MNGVDKAEKKRAGLSVLQMLKKGMQLQFMNNRVRLNNFGRPVRIVVERVTDDGKHLTYLGKYPISKDGLDRAVSAAITGYVEKTDLSVCSVCGEPAKYLIGSEGRCHSHKRSEVNDLPQ